MTYLCAAIFVRDLGQAKRDAIAAAESGADMLELRIDGVTDPTPIQQLLQSVTLPTIVTCRPTWEGGESELVESKRLALLDFAASSGANYVDIELESYRRISNIEWRATTPRDRRPGLIVSSHHFRTRPPRLMNLLAEIEDSAGDVNKVVWMARSIRDNLEAFELLLHRSKPTIALCMGEAGLISRVLAKKLGAFLTFAGIRKDDVTAPGQLSLEEMKRLYRWDAIGARTKVYGVVGCPVAHSMSPAIHNAAFDQTGYDGIYLPLLVNEGYESFKAFMESFLAFEPLDLSGLSVTIPHKQNALRYLREKNGAVDELASRIGAVNTIVIDRQPNAMQPRGLNTDYGAILDSITARLGVARGAMPDHRVAVIGAGGTGRTAVAALAHCGASVVIYNRTRERAEALASEFNGKTGKVEAASTEDLPDSRCDIYINTTSVGMHPDVVASPFGDRPPRLSPDTLVFDAVYNPRKTKLLGQAEAAGAKTLSGIEMFVRQAAAQFQAWTGRPAPVDFMRSVVEANLSGR